MVMGSISSDALLQSLPAGVRRRLEELVRSLRDTLGDDLDAIIAHGSVARGEYVEGHSDIDILIVLRRDERDRLEAIGPALKLASYSARIEAILLASAEIPNAADVFPLLFGDVRQSHALLHGRDPFAALVIPDAHVRLRIETELRDIRIRLRRVVTEAAGDPALLSGPIERKLKQIRSPLRALLRLRGEEVDDKLETVLRAACKAYGLGPEPLLNLSASLDKAHDVLRSLLDAAIEDVDARDDHKNGGMT
jgi:predicted nucleotidyltransferase